jgi:hypothetical protein
VKTEVTPVNITSVLEWYVIFRKSTKV